MIVNFEDYNRDHVELLILTAIMQIGTEGIDSKKMELEFKVNGKEVDIIKIFERFQEDLDWQLEVVKKEAKEEVKRTIISNLEDVFDDFQGLVSDRIDDTLLKEEQ